MQPFTVWPSQVSNWSFTVEFSGKDIVQDLNRLLKLGASGSSSTRRKLFSDLFEDSLLHRKYDE